MKQFNRVLLIASALLALAACTRAVLMPAPVIMVPAGVGQGQVKAAIVNALDGRGWSIDKLQDGNILTTLHLRDHTATVRVTYDTNSVHISYVSSTNLEYRTEKGVRYIHRNYNGWIGFLEQDIRRNLQNAQSVGRN